MIKEVELSARLKALADMVTPGIRVCDVGCDHGFLSIYLVSRKISPGVLAMDVRPGPLSRAREHVAEFGLGDYIETRLSDGLTNMEAGEAGSLVCAGMGGRLMQRILSREREKTESFEEMILQPQSEIRAFRVFLRSCGYRTVDENMIEEEGKFYPMMKVVPYKDPVSCEEPFSKSACYFTEASQGMSDCDRQLYDQFGELLLKSGHPVLLRYLEYRRACLGRIRRKLKENDTERAAGRLMEVDGELSDIDRAVREYYHGI